MDRNDRNRSRGNHRNWSNWKNQKPSPNAVPDKQSEPRRPKVAAVSQQQILEETQAIDEFKKNMPVCARCGQPITDMSTAIADRGSGAPVHFDCVIDYLNNSEAHAPEDKITYIGQGRFAVIHYENPHDTKHFQIVRIIEWENHENKSEWRDQIAGLYSQTK